MKYGLLTTGHWPLTTHYRFLRVSHIHQQREHPEQRAQHVLAPGDPRDRLDMERVQGEQGGDKGAAPGGAGQAAEQHEQQEGIGGVEQQAGQVVAGRAHPKQLTIQQE